MTHHFVAAGVNHYNDPSFVPLQAAINDAAMLAGLFRHRLGYVTRLLTDPTADEFVVGVLGSAKQTKAGDSLVIYLACHGVTVGNHPMVLLRNAEAGFLKEDIPIGAPGIVSVDALIQLLRAWQDVRRLIILDACSRTDTRKELGSRGFGLVRKAEDFKNSDSGALPGSSGAHGSSVGVLAACARGQRTWEIPTLGRGVFALALEDLVEQAAKSGEPLMVDSRFVGELALRMRAHVPADVGIAVMPTPELVGACDQPFNLIPT